MSRAPILVCAVALVAAGWLGLCGAVRADAVADFYKGKTITLIISTGEGDGNDKTARIVAHHWTEHIPGKPTIVPKNMPGAGNLRATSFLYNEAPKDGTTIGAIIPAVVLQQMLGGTGVTYDASKFGWIGSSNSSNPMIYVARSAGVRTLEDAMKREVLMGGTGAGSNAVLYPTILNSILGTRFKVIMGYRASSEVNLAMARGEVEGRAGETFNILMANNPDLVRDGKIDILVQIGRDKEPGFETIPLLTEFAHDAMSRSVLGLFGDVIALGRPYLAPPGTPPDRLAALRASFDAAMTDPALLAEIARSRLQIAPTGGAELQSLVDSMLKTDKTVLARARMALETKESAVGGEGRAD